MRKFIQIYFVILPALYVQLSWAQSSPALGYYAQKLFGEEEKEIKSIEFRPLKYTDKVVELLQLHSGEFQYISCDTIYTAPKEIKIQSAAFKSNDRHRILVLLSNGTRVILHEIQPAVWHNEQTVPDLSSRFFGAKRIVGDAVYILASAKIYVSRDTAKTWELDTVNIGNQSVQDIAVDTNNYGWIVTQNRNLYYQHPDSNIWHLNTSYTTTGFPHAVFVDRKGRMFVSSSNAATRVQMSTDGGGSWINISNGITETILLFGDDAFDNIYAVGQTSQAFRLSNLTPPWVAIGDSINAQAYLPSNAKIINSMSGDSVVYAATKYGLFQSSDFGTTWVHSPGSRQSKSHIFYIPIVRGGNYYFISTNLGLYRVAAGDTIWDKVFPQQGYISGINNLSSDSAGNLYSNLPFKTGPSTSKFSNVKSSDFGTTWIPDTAGQGALGLTSGTQSFDFSVDKQGTQYLGGNGVLYSKKPGQSWKIDTAGLGMKSGEYIADVSLNNKKGMTFIGRRTGIYPTYNFGLYQRMVGDSVWHSVNTSSTSIGESRLLSDQDGNIVIRTVSSPYKIWKYNGSTWSEVPVPAGIGTTPFINPMSVDNDGVIWGAFFAGGSNKGVYFTKDNGTTWNYAGLNGVGVNFLSSIDEGASGLSKTSVSSSTTYAVTYIDGIYGFKSETAPVTSVGNSNPNVISTYELYQNYPNPFNPTTTIAFNIPEAGIVTLKVYDSIGREVKTLLNELKAAGRYDVRFDASSLSTGLYFYRIRANAFTQAKKLLLIK